VQDVYLGNDPNSTVFYALVDDKLSISWQSASPISLQKGEALLTLQLSVSQFPDANEIKLSLSPSQMNELADNYYNVINEASLVVDIVKTSALSIFDQKATEHIALECSPNPFTESLSFEYSIPVDGEVILEIYNMVGGKIKVVIDELQSAGDYSLKVYDLALQPGIYMAVLKVDGKTDSFKTTIKMISK
jgi:hypothetical protein